MDEMVDAVVVAGITTITLNVNHHREEEEEDDHSIMPHLIV
jgi:hypothetical protein